MIAVAADELADVLIGEAHKDGIVVKELPARDGLYGQQAEAVAGIDHRRILRVMAQTHDVEAVVAHLIDVAIVRIVRDGVADVGIFLMAVCAAEVIGPAVDTEAVLAGDIEGADADDGRLAVHDLTVLHQLCLEAVEAGRVGIPEQRTSHGECLAERGV